MRSRWVALSVVVCLAGFSEPAGARVSTPRKTAKRLIKFPRQSQTVRFDKLTGAVKQHLKSQFSFRRINRKKDLSWRGPSLPRFLAATCLSYNDHFKASNLRYSEQEQGRDALTEILGTVVQVGMEQGRRLVASGTRLQGTERHLRRAKKLAKAGDVAAAGKAVASAEASMPSLPKHVRTARKRYAGLEGKDWPKATPLPVPPDRLVDAAVDVLLQAYKVKSKSGKPASKAKLRAAVMVGIEAGIEQGKRYSMERNNLYGLGHIQTRFDMARLLMRPDMPASPEMREMRQSQTDSLLSSISDFKRGR